MDRSIGDMPTLPGGNERSWKGILQPGTFFGRYKVHRFLGRGGMGEVYEVEHDLDGAHYAMKVLSSEIPQTSENIHRFEREARVMARLQHPNVVSVDYFDETDGKYWFRMELARGIEEGVVTLGDLAAKTDGRIGQALLACLFIQILDGLSCAHEKGVIHRDLKPGNILLVHSDEMTGGIVPKISDFGLVRLVGQDWLLKKTLVSAQQSLEERDADGSMNSQGLSTQSLVGTYAYMSPEQKQRKKIDERSDIYAVGLMIYRLLTGYTNPGEKIRNKDSTLHAFWQRIIDQSVREDPKDRFSSATAMLAELRCGRRVLASLDGKASLQKCNVEFQAKRLYTANRYLDEAIMIFPNDPKVLSFKVLMREQLGTLQDLKSKMQDFKRRKKYDDALVVSEQFCTLCVEDGDINKFIGEYPQLVTVEQTRKFIEEALRLLKAEEFDAAIQAARQALSLDPKNSRAKQILDQARTMLKQVRIQQTKEQMSRGLHEAYSLLKQKRYAKAMDTLKQTPCSDSNHPKVIALRNACEAGLKKIRQYWERAEEARKSSDHLGAISLLNEVLDSVAPEDPGTLERLNRFKTEAHQLSASLTDMDHVWKNKSYKNCLAAAESILAIQPDHDKAQQYKLTCIGKIRSIQSCIDKAEEYYQNQQYDEAVAAFKQTRKYYYLGKRRAENDTEIETLHNVYSPEYKEIQDRITTIRKEKASMEQALQRAKERLEAGDLLETRLALDEYFKLQTSGQEGLVLQQKLEALHHHARMMKRIRKGIVYLVVAAVLGLSLAYGAASLVASYRMQNKLEESYTALTFANLKEMQSDADSRLDKLQRSRLTPLFSIEARWKCWKDNLDSSKPAWEDYARGAYEEGQEKLKNLTPTEFTPLIQHAFDGFVRKTNAMCVDVNNYLVEGKYKDSVDTCNTFLLEYPQHSHVLDLLQKINRARDLEKCIDDPNVDIGTSVSEYILDLFKIAPRHHRRQEFEKKCIASVESKCDFLNTALPADENDIKEQFDLCENLLKELALFGQFHGYDALNKRLTDRCKALQEQRDKAVAEEDYSSKLATADDLIKRRCWGKARDVLDTLDPTRQEVKQRKKTVADYMTQIEDIIKRADEQVEKENWLDARETISKVWNLWSRDDTGHLPNKATELEQKIHEFMDKEDEGILEFVEGMDQKSHDQIQKFVREHIDCNSDLTLVYDKWFSRLNREAKDALAQKKINTVVDLLGRVLNDEKIVSDANDKKLNELLREMDKNKSTAKNSSDNTLWYTDQARLLQNKRSPEALWNIHQALEKNAECKDANDMLTKFQAAERLSSQNWRKARSLYDEKCYFQAARDLKLSEDCFPGDLRVTALSHDLVKKIEAASQAAENVLSGKMSVTEFYDTYADYNFPSNVSKKIKKAILKDLKERLQNISQEEKRSIIIEARGKVLEGEIEYQELKNKYINKDAYHSETKHGPNSTSQSDPKWCRIDFALPPPNIKMTLLIEGHRWEAPQTAFTAFVRWEDDIQVEVSDPNHKRIEKLNLKPWEVNPKPFNKYCLSLKEAQVQVVKKGWLFKEFDLNAMADQIIKEYHIEESQARESLKGALDRMKGKENGSTIQVPLIGEWKEKLFADADS